MTAPREIKIYLDTDDGKVEFVISTTSDKIDLRRKGLNTLPSELQKCENTKSLLADENHLSSIPPWISKLSNLKVLSLRQQDAKRNPNYSIPDASVGGLKNLPDEIGEAKTLQELYLTGNKLMTLPPTMKNLASLTMIDLMGNEFIDIPENIFLLKNLKYLGLSGNYIKEIPPWIRQMKKLKILRLSNNEIKFLPKELFTLTSLISLSLRNNKITTLPKEITHLTNLVPGNDVRNSFNLGARNTKYNLKWENGLQIEGNPLEHPPAKTCQKGLKEIIKYFEEEKKDEFYKGLLVSLSQQIGHEWEALGTQLGFSRAKLDQFVMDEPHSAQKRILRMLQTWWEDQDLQMQEIAKKLILALKKVERVDLAEEVEKVVF